jgi:phosphatidylglycerophosphate synthase
MSQIVPASDGARLPLTVVFDLEGDCLRGALTRVCGLPVLLRNLLLCQRHGVTRVILSCADSDRPRVEAALASRPVALPLVWARGPREAALPVEGDVVHWPAALTFGRFFPESLGTDRGRPLVVPGSRPDGPALLRAPVAAWLASEPGARPTAPLWTDRAEALRLSLAPARETSAHAVHEVRDRASARDAEAALLRSLRKNADGAVAKYDRYVSLAISRFLMKLPVTPNHVTCAAALLGALCGVLVAFGGYLPMLLGALAFQFNSIFDGIDGEIARAKLLESRLGQWLDTLADDFSNFAFVVGVGVGCYHTYHWSGYWMLGLIAGLGQLCSSAVQYHYIITVARSGDLNDFKPPWEAHAPSERPRDGGEPRGLISRIEWLFRRDAFVAMSTAFAIIGQLRVLTWIFAIGANLVWTSVLGYRAVMGLNAAGQSRRAA